MKTLTECKICIGDSGGRDTVVVLAPLVAENDPAETIFELLVMHVCKINCIVKQLTVRFFPLFVVIIFQTVVCGE